MNSTFNVLAHSIAEQGCSGAAVMLTMEHDRDVA